MNGTKKRIFPVHYAPGKALFHIIVKLSDAPGSYSSVLDLLRSKVNLIGTSTYTHSDGTAMFSGFAEGISPHTTAKGLEDLIMESKAAMSADVREGKEGLLVDTYHTGFVVGSDEYILMRREGLVRVFERVSKMLGTGGDTILYEEGKAMGMRNAEIMAETIGLERVRAQISVLNRFLAAQGWGVLEGEEDLGKGGYTVTVTDCFECSESTASLKRCSFMRGYLAGAAFASYGNDYSSEETSCRLRGAKSCVFRLTPQA